MNNVTNIKFMERIMDILVYPHEILKTKAHRVKVIDGALQKMIDQMFSTMYEAKGLGLAANQVGELKQLVVMDVSGAGESKKPVVLINPVIVASEGEEVSEEGCLSVPNYSAKIKRAAKVEVVGYDRHEREIRIQAEGLLARCIQHELDHLNGICFVDRLSPVRRAIFRKKWAKIRPDKKT